MNIIEEEKILKILANSKKENPDQVHAVLEKAKKKKGLSLEDVSVLIQIASPDLLEALFQVAKEIKQEIYGDRLVLFAPLYISNFCSNDCVYCAFRESNQSLVRRSLLQKEIAKEAEILVSQGHKRLLLVAGESFTENSLDYVLESIDTIYSVTKDKGSIRRLNVNLAPLSEEDFLRLKEKQIGTYQLFQETYHRATYAAVHLGGKKQDYDWRITALDRAMKSGIDDIGIGVLFGLADWRFELLALLQHSQYLENTYGVGPHTISVPRIEPAKGSPLSENPPHPVSDDDFCKLVAILRLAVPYTGIILSTRENPDLRRRVLSLGVSQISAGSRTNPGGYQEEESGSQFSLGDHRPLDAVIQDIANMGYIPSFCTACYRLGRTGHEFMNFAKPGKIKDICTPNALATFQEYLNDYASEETKRIGEKLIREKLMTMPEAEKQLAEKMIDQVRNGQRDVYV